MPLYRNRDEHIECLIARIRELETAIETLVNSITKPLPDGYVYPLKEPEFVTAFKRCEQLLKKTNHWRYLTQTKRRKEKG